MSAAGPQRRHRGLSSASGSPGIRCSQDRRSLGPQRLGTRVLCTCEDALRFLDEGTHLVGTEPFPVPRTQIPRPSDRGRPARMTASPGEVRKHAVRPTPATARLAIPSLLRESTRPTRPPRPPRSAESGPEEARHVGLNQGTARACFTTCEALSHSVCYSSFMIALCGAHSREIGALGYSRRR